MEKFEPLLTRKREFVQKLEDDISDILESGNSDEKIRILEDLDSTGSPEILEKIILRLDDDDIRVRGEAFSSLVLNENKISNILINGLSSTSKNIRGYTSLILANRNETVAVPEIMKLASDERSMVRSCAIGALGYLKTLEAKEIFLESLFDTNVEVRKSAMQAVIDLNIGVSEDRIKEISQEDYQSDPEMERLLSKLKKCNGGPEGI